MPPQFPFDRGRVRIRTRVTAPLCHLLDRARGMRVMGEDGSMALPESRHVSIYLDALAADVAAYIADPRNLVHWAAGLADGQVQLVDGEWKASSPLGDITVEFARANDLGVVDHVVRTAQGQSFYNPMRVLPDGDL